MCGPGSCSDLDSVVVGGRVEHILLDAMDDDKMKRFIETFSEQFLKLAEQVSELRASVNVLKIHLVSQLSPGDPAEGLKQLRVLEQKLLDSDQNEKGRKEAAEIIAAVRAWRKSGGHEA